MSININALEADIKVRDIMIRDIMDVLLSDTAYSDATRDHLLEGLNASIRMRRSSVADLKAAKDINARKGA